MSQRVFNKVQIGIENPASHGTPVAASKILSGASIRPLPLDRKPTFPEDSIGVRGRYSRGPFFYEYLVRDSLVFPHAYFEALCYVFSLGIKGAITPAEQTGGQGDMLWDFTPSMTASTNALDSATIEKGDNTQAYEEEYSTVERIKISGEISQTGEASPVVVEAEYFARQETDTTFTGSLSPVATQTMNAKLARFFVDAAWANRLTTEKTGLLRAFDIEILTGAHPAFDGDANRYFTSAKEGMISAMAALTFQRGSSSDSERDTMRAGTQQAIGLKIEGPQIGTGQKHTLSLALWGAYEEAIPIASEALGSNLDTFVFQALYGSTGAQIIEPKVITTLAAL